MRLISKLHADADSKPLFLAPLEGQVSDYKDAVPLLNSLPRAKEILAGYGADENWLHGTLISRGMYSAKKIETSLFYYDKNK